VAPPVDGPSRWTKAITTGVSVITANKAVSLDGLGENDEAVAAYDALVATFRGDDRPAFVEEDVPSVDVLVARARSRRDYLARS
jgi:hypothetical protein